MKIRCAIIIAAILLALGLALGTAGAEEEPILPAEPQEPILPAELQELIQPEITDTLAISDYTELPAEGWAFVALQNEVGYNRLIIFQRTQNGWTKWLQTDKAIWQGTNKIFLMADSIGSNHYVNPTNESVSGPVFQIIQYNAPEGDPALADPERRVEFNLQDGKWLLTWWEDNQHCAVRIKAKEMLYYGTGAAGYNYQGGVAGTIQRDIRYFELQYMPQSLQIAEKSVTVAPMIPTGMLQAQDIQFTGGKRFEVYSGPGEQYLRSGDGKAAVSTNDWIQVFGREAGWILIQYDIDRGHMRFGWIREAALPQDANVPGFRFTYTFAFTAAGTFITDDPLNSQAQLMTLAAGEPLTILATMGDWAYVEKDGTTAADGTLIPPVRGFVRSNALTYSVAYSMDGNGHVIPAHDYREAPADMEGWKRTVWRLAGYENITAEQECYFADDGTLLELQDTAVPWLNEVYQSDNIQWGGEAYPLDAETNAKLISFLDAVNPGMSRGYQNGGWMEWKCTMNGIQYAQYNLQPEDPVEGEWLTFTVEESPEWKIQYFACISNG